MDDALNSRAICAMERIGRVLDNDALDNETCLETLRKVARIYQEEMGMPPERQPLSGYADAALCAPNAARNRRRRRRLGRST